MGLCIVYPYAMNIPIQMRCKITIDIHFCSTLKMCMFLFIEFYENRNNCFEQLCINYTNERLHQFFAQTMLKNEQEWHKKENINVPKFEYFDNSHIVGELKFK